MNLRAFSLRRVAVAAFACLVLLIAPARADTTLTTGKVGQNYTYQVTPSTTPPAGTVYSATGLPAGLSINSSSGLVSGKPTTAGTYNGTISLTSGGVTNTFNTVLTIDPATGTPVISSLTTATATVGQLFSYSPTASDSPTSFNIGTLPSGISVGGTATVPSISGTPAVAGTYNITLSANNASGTGATKTLVLTVNPAGPVPSITSATTAVGTPGSSFSYPITTNIAAISYSAGGLPVGLSLNSSTGVISGTPSAGGSYSVVLSATNNNGTGPTTTLSLAIGTSSITSALSASGGVGVPFNYTITADRTPLSFDVTGAPSWMTVNTSTGVLGGTPTSAGTSTIRLKANNSAGAGVAVNLTLTIGNLPIISSASSASGTAGTAFLYQISASNSPTSYSATGLPAGLSLNTSSGLISGSPSAAGTSSVTLTATNGAGAGPAFTLLLNIATGSSGGGGGAGGGVVVTPAPTIAAQPASQSVTEGSVVTFSVVANNALTYQWNKDGIAILGANGNVLTLTDVKSGDSGSYTVTVTNFSGSVTSAVATLTVTGLLTPPVIAAQPASQTVAPGANVTFTASASGNPTPTYQWFKNGTAINGATQATLSLSNVQTTDNASYSVVATNSQGSITSSLAVLTVTTSTIAPSITTQPVAVATTIGRAASFTVVASGVPTPTYQWQKDGVAIVGATATTYAIANVQAGDLGNYTVVVTNSAGSVTSQVAALTVVSSRLINFSVRASAGTGDQTLIVGFNVAGTGQKQALVRAVGPTLTSLGVAGALADPQLRLFNGTSVQINQNDDWGGTAALNAAFTAAGAFALPATSKDAALALGLDGGSYSVQVNGAGTTTGVVLVEAYDIDNASIPARLANLSARNQVGTGENILIAGFVIAGEGSKTLLIRGIGPSLTQFGVGGALVDPQLAVYDSKSAVVAQNDNWGGSTELASAFIQTGAFALAGSSRDAALLVTLPPGAYTAQLSGVNSTTGVGLVEIYVLP